MSDALTFRILTADYIHEIAVLGQQLNPSLTLQETKDYLIQMFEFEHYTCFGVFKESQLIGISSAWTTVRLYCGKQLEVDNVIIDPTIQSQGIGKLFFEYIETWAKDHDYKTIELNTYIQNAKSHKFYFNLGYSNLGLHFLKKL
jgi:GNAT superfamily N-acetyltransferase